MGGVSADCRTWLRGAKQGVPELDRVPGDLERANIVDPTLVAELPGDQSS